MMENIKGSGLYLGLDVSAVAGDEVAADAGDVQPLQSPLTQHLASLGVLLQLEFDARPRHDQVPHQVALAREDLFLLADLEGLEGDVQRALMLLEALALEGRVSDEVLHQLHGGEVLVVCGAFGDSEGGGLGDEEVEGADEDALVDLEDGVGIGPGEHQLVGGVVVLAADGEEEGLVDF